MHRLGIDTTAAVVITFSLGFETLAGSITLRNIHEHALIGTLTAETSPGGVEISFDVFINPGQSKTYDPPSGQWLVNKSYKSDSAGLSFGFFAAGMVDETETFEFYEDAAGVSEVFTFVDADGVFSNELLSNSEFEFAGLVPGDGGAMVPDLRLFGTSTRITDDSGALFPQYAFTGTLEVAGTMSGIPAPSAVALAGVWFLACGARRRR